MKFEHLWMPLSGCPILHFKPILRQKTKKSSVEHVHTAANSSFYALSTDILFFLKLKLENDDWKAPFYLSDLMEEVMHLHSYHAYEKGIEFIVHIPETFSKEEAPYLLGDKIRLGQILNNLLLLECAIFSKCLLELANACTEEIVDPETINSSVNQSKPV